MSVPVMLTRHQISTKTATIVIMTKTKTPTLKTKTRPRHYMANIYATFMGSVHKHSLLIFVTITQYPIISKKITHLQQS